MRSASIGRAGLLALAAGCGADATAAAQTPEPRPATHAIPRGAVWAYWDRGGDLAAAWAAPTFDDTSWARGTGPLGYGESYLATSLGFGASPSARHVTTYFRTQFDVADPAAVTALAGELMFDDGVVIFLNGKRIGDASMPPGPAIATTRARGHEADGEYQRYDWSAHRELLVGGTNTIAVELHQSDPASSDLVFDLSMRWADGPQP